MLYILMAVVVFIISSFVMGWCVYKEFVEPEASLFAPEPSAKYEGYFIIATFVWAVSIPSIGILCIIGF